MSLNLNLSDKLVREMLNSMKVVMNDVLDECGKKYSFDAEEAKKMMEEMLSLKKEAKVKEEKIKRGRPKTAAEKSPKGAKGRPKKSKKTLELNDNVEEDLFASLVAAASKEDDDDNISTESEEAAIEGSMEVQEAPMEAQEAPKEAQEAPIEEEKQKKEQKEKVEKTKKELKEKVEEKKEEKVEEEEADVVKRFEFEGVKYLKSKKTGEVYNMDQDVVGKWDEKNNKIEFAECESEEEEEEYDE